MAAKNRKLALACGDYDRTRALREGRITPEGVDLTYLKLEVEETFFRMMKYQEFDVAEMSLSSYVLSLDDPAPPFVAIPVFPSRAFRHSGIYVNSESGIREPSDLVGKRVGLPEYQLTALVWIRGILDEHHGVPFDGVTYVIGGVEDASRIEKKAVTPPESVRVERAPAGRPLAQLLEDGEIDAIYCPRAPSTYGKGKVVRLFDDVVAVEQDYFRKTGIFPTMHTVVIRRELYEGAPWVARNFYTAFEESLAEVREALHDTTALRYSLPWLTAQAEEAEALMGENAWAYGLEANRDVLATFLKYHHQQGVSKELREPESLFVQETLESFAI